MMRSFAVVIASLVACAAFAQDFDPATAAPPDFAWPAEPASIPLPALAQGQAYGGYVFHEGDLYLASYRENGDLDPWLLVIDPLSGAVTQTRKLGNGIFPRCLCVVRDTLFIGTSTEIWFLDRSSLSTRGAAGIRALRPSADWYIRGAVTGDGEIFYMTFAEDNAVYRYDRQARRLERWCSLPPDASPRALVLHQERLYAVDSFHYLIYSIDPRRAVIDGEILFTRCSAYNAASFLGDTLYMYDRDETVIQRMPFQRVGSSVIRSDPVRYRVQARLTVRNESSSRGAQVARRVVAVPATDVHQQIESLSYQGPQPRVERDRYGQAVAVFDAQSLAPGAEAVVGWTADVTVWNVRHRIDGARLRAIGDVPRRIAADYGTTSYFRLSGGDAVLDQIARQISASSGPDPIRLVHATRDLVWDRLSYELHYPWRTAADIFRVGRGTCGEYSFLMSALLRRTGLPTRFVGASTSRGLPRRTDEVYHGWIEVYLPGYGWAPMDANMNDTDRGAPYSNQLMFAESRNMLVVSRGGHEDDAFLGPSYNCAVTTASGSTRSGIAYDWERRDE